MVEVKWPASCRLEVKFPGPNRHFQTVQMTASTGTLPPRSQQAWPSSSVAAWMTTITCHWTSPSLTISGYATAAGKRAVIWLSAIPEKERAAAPVAWYSKACAASSVDVHYCNVADRTVVRQLSVLALLEPEPMVE
jgi:hypothetical protein